MNILIYHKYILLFSNTRKTTFVMYKIIDISGGRGVLTYKIIVFHVFTIEVRHIYLTLFVTQVNLSSVVCGFFTSIYGILSGGPSKLVRKVGQYIIENKLMRQL